MSVVGQKRFRDEINQKYLWYHRLSHIREDRINKLKKDEILDSFGSEWYLACESYLREKIVKLPFVEYGKRVIELLALVHTNVYELFDVQVRGGYSYFIIFTDDLWWYGYVFLMRHKYEVFEKFKKFRNEIDK